MCMSCNQINAVAESLSKINNENYNLIFSLNKLEIKTSVVNLFLITNSSISTYLCESSSFNQIKTFQ